MNKTELKQATAAVSGLSLKDVSLALAGVLHVIETTLQQGDKVVVPGRSVRHAWDATRARVNRSKLQPRRS